MKLTFKQIKYHRNGVAGAPFHVALFRDESEGNMLGIVFEEKHHVAVFNLDRLSLFDLGLEAIRAATTTNGTLRNAIKALEAERI